MYLRGRITRRKDRRDCGRRDTADYGSCGEGGGRPSPMVIYEPAAPECASGKTKKPSTALRRILNWEEDRWGRRVL